MESKSFFPAASADMLPMTLQYSFEGVKEQELVSRLFAFDIETFSPRGFPSQVEDPIVNFSLVAPFAGKGIVVLSAIAEPALERELLILLHKCFSGLSGACLLTYNGLKFDVEYVAQRGSLYGLNFENVFANLRHVDVYRLLKWLNVNFPRYDQKSVERCLGISRVIRHVSGGTYSLVYNDFIRGGDLTPLFYNIEDSFGCLRIAGKIRSLLERRR